MPYFTQPYQPYQGVPDQLMQMRQQQFQPQFPQQYVPQQFPQAQIQQQNNGSIVRVKNEQEAKDFLVAPNCFVIMIDAYSPRIYMKKADASGKAEFEIYEKSADIQTPVQQPINPNDEVITLGKLMNVLSNLGLMPGKFTKEAREAAANE